jgi:uncharacterized repeat protein (TIGR03806 family)
MFRKGALVLSAMVAFPGVSGGQGVPPYGLPSRPSAPPYLGMPTDETGTIPATLSLTGAFADTAALTPAAPLIPYALNSPFWSDGAVKTRWISLPTGSTIGFAATGEWTFPAGTVVVKHFELPTDEANPAVRTRLETRLLVMKSNGTAYGVTYKWRADNTDADLLPGSLTENHPIAQAGGGSYTKAYLYPSRSDCLLCHSTAGGFLLGLTTKQLNASFLYPSTGIADNQLRTWSYIGMFAAPPAETAIPSLDRLVPVNDPAASAEDRVRSYLHSNCSHCHRPGGLGTGPLDARYETALASQGLVDAPVGSTLGIDGAMEAAPRDIWRSHLYVRVNTTGNGRMPPIARNATDAAAIATIVEWIESLAGTPALAPPAISPDGGPFSAPVSAALQHPDPLAELRYTLDGSDPSASSTLYAGAAIPISVDTTLTARAFRSGYSRSAAATAFFTFGAPANPRVQAPAISPNGGAFTGSVLVTLSTATAGAVIRWTADGSEPTPQSRQYVAPFALATHTTLRAKAFNAGMDPSPVSSAVFLVSRPVWGGGGGGGGCGATGLEAALLLVLLLAAGRRFPCNTPSGGVD